MKITTAAEMRAIDLRTADECGIATLELMEKAGAAVARLALTHQPLRRAVVLCGKGNNGGDGLVAARLIHQAGVETKVYLFADPAALAGDAAASHEKLSAPQVVVLGEAELAELRHDLSRADLILDALLGTGFRPPVEGLMAQAIEAVNAVDAAVLAVDIPSGAAADEKLPPSGLVCRADAIVTFTAPQPAHLFAPLSGGPIYLAQIGTPASLIGSELRTEVTTAAEVVPLLAPRAPESNKGSFGHVLVLGGSLGKAGAVSMAGMAALRTGAGLVSLGVPFGILNTVAAFAPEYMTIPLAETEAGGIAEEALEPEAMETLLARKTVVALGPGLGTDEETQSFARAFVRDCGIPLVVDADGLNAFAGQANLLDGRERTLVLTPHPGEMARLTGLSVAGVQADRTGIARHFAMKHHCIVVLKGHRSVTALPSGELWINMTGNPGMATGGTGDLLTGLIAGLLAQFPERAAEVVPAAVWLHGAAGDRARGHLGEQPMIATDLLRFLPEVWTQAREWAAAPFLRIC
jgi:NAD(P)H-hydrate epimerase